jgi:aldose 1-epimerase
MSSRTWGRLPDGGRAHLYRLADGDGCEVEVSDYGATITSVMVPDEEGALGEVTLGHSDLEGYLGSKVYLGCVVGRYANRIRDGLFALDGEEYSVTRNHGAHHLHGGRRGFDKVLWSLDSASGSHASFSYLSADGEEGYPGNLRAKVEYTLRGRALSITYTAVTDSPTVVNLTNHTYWNLAGRGDVLSHVLRINADSYTPSDGDLIPIGVIAPVRGTPLDLRVPMCLGDGLNSNHPEVLSTGGYDHNYVLNGLGLRLVAELSEPSSGRTMEVYTTQPGLQLYTGNFLDGSEAGRGGLPLLRHHGLCLETQHFPDSPNHPGFPSTVLRRGETFFEETMFRFRVE